MKNLFTEEFGGGGEVVFAEGGNVVSAIEHCGGENVVFVDIDAMLGADIGEGDFISGEIHGL